MTPGLAYQHQIEHLLDMGEEEMNEQDKQQVRNQALEDAAEILEVMVQGIGDAASYDKRDLYDWEQECATTAREGARRIRGLQSAAAAAPSPVAQPQDEREDWKAQNLRQYRHNDGSGLVFGYDMEGIERLVATLQANAEADASRMDWLQTKCTGASDSERYLPFRIYWGPGQHKSIREVIDAAMQAQGANE